MSPLHSVGSLPGRTGECCGPVKGNSADHEGGRPSTAPAAKAMVAHLAARYRGTATWVDRYVTSRLYLTDQGRQLFRDGEMGNHLPGTIHSRRGLFDLRQKHQILARADAECI
jgi:hypothetical protein